MKGFRNLHVWTKSHQLTLDIYKSTQQFPKEELFGLVSQLRRPSTSIPTNIAEGSGRKSEKEFIQFLSIALGSANEVDYLIELSKDLGFISQEVWNQLDQEINEIQSMPFVLIRNKSERS